LFHDRPTYRAGRDDRRVGLFGGDVFRQLEQRGARAFFFDEAKGLAHPEGNVVAADDLARVGGKYPHLWHVRHMEDPQSIVPQSIMPAYAWLLTDDIDFSVIQPRVDAMAMLGVPYGEAVQRAEEMARAQARTIGAEIVAQGGPPGLEGKQIAALVAYLQRLGTDIKKPPPSTTDERAPVAGSNFAPAGRFSAL
jgi:hypothetical protein